MTPDDLRRALQGATPELQEAAADTLIECISPYAEIWTSAIEVSGMAFEAVLALATLTDAQRADAWHAARDRVATGEGEATPETDGGIPITVWTLDTATGEASPPDVAFNIISRTFEVLGHPHTIYGYIDADGNEHFPGV